MKGYTQRAGWSTEPIDIKALGLVDVDATLALADVTYGHTRIDGAQVSVGVKDQVAKVTLAELRLYNGRGHGLVTLDGIGGRASLHGRRFSVGHRRPAAAARTRRRSTGLPATPTWPGRYPGTAPGRRRWCNRSTAPPT